MDLLEKMNNAINYIEENLMDEVSFDKVAKIVCCSTYHFQRMFSFIMGVSISEYIRRRRLTLAAFELQTGDSKIIDIAMKYGYECVSLGATIRIIFRKTFLIVLASNGSATSLPAC